MRQNVVMVAIAVGVQVLLVAAIVSCSVDAEERFHEGGLSLGSPSDELGPEDKRAAPGAWNKLQGGWGKRAENWNRLNAVWGKRPERGWNNLSGMWGKRADKWNNLSGMWGKRGWNDMSGGWGKREQWNNLKGMWGKRSGASASDSRGSMALKNVL